MDLRSIDRPAAGKLSQEAHRRAEPLMDLQQTPGHALQRGQPASSTMPESLGRSVALDTAALVTRAHALLVYHGLLEQPPLRELVALLDRLALEPSRQGEPDGRAEHEPRGSPPSLRHVLHAYGALFRALLATSLSGRASDPGRETADGTGETPVEPEAGAVSWRLDACRAALAQAILRDENPFSAAAARLGARLEQVAGSRAGPAVPAARAGRPGPLVEYLPQALVAAAAADLRTLQELAAAAARLPAAVAQLARAAGLTDLPALPVASLQDGGGYGCAFGPVSEEPAAAPSADLQYAGQRPEAFGPVSEEPAGGPAPGQGAPHFVARLATAADWGALVPELAAYYATHGTGMLAHHRAFRWLGAAAGDPESAAGASAAREWLVPVPVPDAVQPDDLIGYEAERALLRRNTAYFLAGYAANNVLLYGDRGTGKSSSIKALLNEQCARHAPGSVEARVDWSRLRLIEVPKARLADFPLLVALLRDRPQRFIVFVDDLSFEEGETDYKHLKALLEGGLEARPPNVVVYATSNRRHLVRESFADRPAPDAEEVHARDTMQEKLSFADRFGLVITFPAPDQALYLEIVEGLARRRGLAIGRAALRARAIEWAAWHNGRSGRTARQFIDHLTAELGLAAARAAARPAPSEE